jgi:antitoxin component of MazEF toxin-antitoxin module
MKKVGKVPFDAKSFDIVTLSEQKLGGRPSQYRINIPPRFIKQMNWQGGQKLVVEARPDNTLIIHPQSSIYIEQE